MADKQPEALWLADAMDCVTDDACGYCMPCRTAAELRRLAAIEAERNALLAENERLAREMQQEWCPAAQGMVRMARAAIKAAEEGK